MRLPHPLLILLTTVFIWLAAGAVTASSYQPQASTYGNPLALFRSAYGSLVARLMKDSLHAYWHEGKQEKSGQQHDEAEHDHLSAGSKLKLLRSRSEDADKEHEEDLAAGSWLENTTHRLAELEDKRTERNSPFATSTAHKRFLTASANWRLYQAYKFDPSDAALYEIAHYTLLSKPTSLERKRLDTEELAKQTIAHSMSPQSGPVAALTAAGAVINLFNEQLMPKRVPAPSAEALKNQWLLLTQCLERYHKLHQQALAEKWWNDIPDIRRQEIDEYARNLERLTEMIRKELTQKQLLP